MTDSPATNDPQTTLKAEIRDYFDSRASNWDTHRRWNSYYKKKVAELARAFVPENASVLEVGCATGDLLAQLKARRRVGIDLSARMLERARLKYSDVQFDVQDIETSVLRESFDVVICSDLVDSLTSLWDAFRGLRQVCSPPTRILITFHNPLWEPFVRLAQILGMMNKQPIQNWFSPKELQEMAQVHGMETIRSGSFLLIPFRVPLISDWINRVLAPLPLINCLCLGRYLVMRALPQPHATSPDGVSVIIPCLNEAGNIEPLLLRVPQMLPWTELIFVDGGSSDGTVETIQALLPRSTPSRRIRLISQEGARGKGGAVRQGFAAAAGEVFMILDSDLSVAPEDLPKFLTALTEGWGELINGARLVYAMEPGAMRFMNFLANHFFRIVFSWMIGQTVRDTLCGTKVLTRQAYQQIDRNRAYFGDFDPFGDFDLLFGAARLNLRIINLPVRYQARTYGTTKIHRWSHGLLLLRMCRVALWKLKMS